MKLDPEKPTPKSPIYPVEVIQAAAKALESLAFAKSNWGNIQVVVERAGEARDVAMRIILDGLLSHERSIKGES